MDKRWYSAAFSALVVGCGGSTDTGSSATSPGGTGGSSSIDGGAPTATGGMFVVYYGIRPSGGYPSQDATGGGTNINSTTALGCPVTEPTVGTACSGGATCFYGRSIDCAYPCGAGCTLAPPDGSAIQSGFDIRSVCTDGHLTTVSDGMFLSSSDCRCPPQN